jgi:two-component system chemotaxis sensor kinase CheA
VGAAWTTLPRLVHDLSRGLAKQVELTLDGGSTELDRQVLEAIRDPLTHLVRNSVDHGLEPPAERRAAGKRDTGRLSLTAGQQNGFVVIELADDGRGLDLDHIRASALAAGLVSPNELAAMDDETVRGLIFCPGLSTAAQVTAISGRGVGLDVVKANIAALGGTIEVASTPGAGTRFVLRIPLTLAVIHALLVRAGGQRFAIAQSAVAEVVRIGDASDAAEGTDGAPVLRLRERTLPVEALARILRLTPREPPIAPDRHVIVLQIGAATFGLLVDQAPDIEEIVVKPLAVMLRHLPVFAGTTILGDGAVVLILDPAGIAEAAGRGGGEAGAPGRAAAEAAEPDGAKPLPMLLFEAGGRPIVVPLGQVARLEQIAADDVTWHETAPDGVPMPLAGGCDAAPRDYTVLVLGGDDADRRRVRLVIGAVDDVVQDMLEIDGPPRMPGLLGAATVGGQAVDVLDTEYWLALAARHGFARPRASARLRRRLLAVDDSAFSRQILSPVLSAAGYDVTAVESAARALRLHEAGENFAAIISDIEMPDIDGLELVRRLRSGGRWAGLPIIALSSRAGARDIEAGRAAGFTDHVAKFQHAALLASLARHLPRPADTLAAA